MRIFGLEDGSAIVVAALNAPSINAGPPVDGTLSLPLDVSAWIGEAVAAGITFDVLKSIVVALIRRGWAARPVPAPATATSVTTAAIDYLEWIGHTDVRLGEVRKVEGQGWRIGGTMGDGRFTVLADETGSIFHVRVL